MEENERIAENAGVGEGQVRQVLLRTKLHKVSVLAQEQKQKQFSEGKLDRSLESHLQLKPTGGSGVQGHPGLG